MQKKTFYLLATLLLASAGFAVEEHAVFNSTPLSAEKRAFIEEEKIRKEEFIRAHEKEIAHLMKTSALGQETAIDSTAFTTFDFHRIVAFPKKCLIAIEDGSQWKYAESDSSKVSKRWKANHAVIISQNSSTEYPYTLTNVDLDSSVDVLGLQGPILDGPYTQEIIGINPDHGHVYLIRGRNHETTCEPSAWRVHKDHLPLFKDWKVDQIVIVGTYDKSWYERHLPWFFPSPDYFLLNVDMNHYIYVSLL